MKYDPFRHHTTGMLRSRRSIREKGYDYAQAGAYFVTIVTRNHECLFGEILDDGDVRLNEFGRKVAVYWHAIPRHFQNVELDEFIVMPNHMHGIIVIAGDDVGARHLPHHANASPLPAQPPRGVAPDSLGAIIGNFKSITTRKINQMRDTQGALVWQRNYYEHIIRSERELDRIREYIANNPFGWASDEENPAGEGGMENVSEK